MGFREVGTQHFPVERKTATKFMKYEQHVIRKV
jgi:hypothetical protein